jgi:isopentenyldiphosphate isomerase
MISKKSALVMVFNNNGELALQLRAAHDEICPSHWDFSAGGGIHEGEIPHKAAHRELREEIGITGNLQFVDEIIYEASKDHLHIYRVVHNGPFIPDPQEVQDVRFFSLKEIKELIDSGAHFHPEFLYVWKRGLIVP